MTVKRTDIIFPIIFCCFWVSESWLGSFGSLDVRRCCRYIERPIKIGRRWNSLPMNQIGWPQVKRTSGAARSSIHPGMKTAPLKGKARFQQVKHPDQEGHLQKDREAARQRVDPRFSVEVHHFHLRFFRIFFIFFLHRFYFRGDLLHLGSKSGSTRR